MRRSLLNKPNLSKSLRQALVLLTILLLPSTAWADYTYGSDEELFFDCDSHQFKSAGAPIWTVSMEGESASWPAIEDPNATTVTYRPFEGFSKLLLTRLDKLKGELTDFALNGNIPSSAHVNIVVYRLATKDATSGTKIGSITINEETTPTYTYTKEDGASQVFNNEYIQLAFEHVEGEASSIGTDDIEKIILTFSGTSYGLKINDVRVTSNNAEDILGDGNVSYSSNTLTLKNDVSLQKIRYSGSDDLTIAFSGNVSISSGDSVTIVSTSDLPELLFSCYSSTNGELPNGSLNLSGGGVIKGFSDVDFGSLNLASTSAPGIYWNEEYNYLSGFEGPALDVTITTEKYYPIWIKDPSLGQNATHTQLKSDKLSVAMDDGTVSFDGNDTITINAITFNYNSNTLIVVGPDMEQLTVNLVGTSTVISESLVFNLWDTTALTFTTDKNNPGSLTATNIISDSFSGQISYNNGLIFNSETITNPDTSTSTYTETISTTGALIKIGSTPISTSTTGDITVDDGTAYFDASTNTLTLTDATIGSATASKDIQVFVDDLKVVISGNNTIYGDITYLGSNNQSSAIQIDKAGDEATLTLSNIYSFGACTWGEGLYLTALIGGQVTTNAIAPHYESLGAESGFSDYEGGTVSKVIFSTTVSYPLWVAGTQVTPENKANILNDARTSISYDDESNTLTLKSAISNPEADFVVLGSGVSTLNVHVTGYNNVGRWDYTVFTSVDDCTVTLIKDETFSGTLDCSNAKYIYSNAVTVMYNGEAITNEGDDTYGRILQDDIDGADISLFGGGQVYDVGTMIEGYNYYESDRPWAFTKATTVTSDGYIPVLCTEATTPYTVSMRPNNESGIGSATKLSLLFDWNGNEPTKDVTAIIESIDGSTNYSSSVTLPKSGGTIEIPITDGGNVLVNGFNVKFSSDDEAFSFALLAARLDYTLNNYLNILGQNIDISQDATINNDNCSFISKGSVVFTVSTKTVTFTDASIVYTDYTVETGIEDLKVNLVGENSVNTGDGESGAFHAITESASIDLEGEGSMTITTLAESPFTDFGEDKITYNKLVCWKSGDENWTIAPPSAPEIKGVMYEGSLAVEISKKYKDGDIYYKIDYAGETEDISERTKYEDSFIMAAPGIVTAWVEVNDAITDEVIGKYFGYIDTPYTIAKGSTKETTIYPLIAEEDGFGISYSSQNESIATFANGTITGVAAGTTQVRSSLTTTNSSLEYTILNQKTTGVDVSDSYIITLDVTVQELIDESTFTSGQNYGTFYNTSTETYKVPEGLVAYIITGVDGNSITISETKILPPNAPVLFYRTDLENAINYTFTQATASDGTFPEGNILEYAFGDIPADASSELYVLYNGKFVKVTTGTDIAAKHCYLNLGEPVANTRGFYYIGSGEGTTAIQKVVLEKSTDGEWYTLQGQRVAKPAKGLYILNGKKIVVK